MNYDVDILHGPLQARRVAHVADEISKAWIFREVRLLGHFVLFQLIPGKYDKSLDIRVAPEDGADKGSSERPGAAGNKYRFILQHDSVFSSRLAVFVVRGRRSRLLYSCRLQRSVRRPAVLSDRTPAGSEHGGRRSES